VYYSPISKIVINKQLQHSRNYRGAGEGKCCESVDLLTWQSDNVAVTMRKGKESSWELF